MRAGFDLIAFDLDGTLVDSAPDLATCLGRALESAGFGPPGEAQTRAWIGDGVEWLVRRGLAHAAGKPPDDATLATALRAFDACYRLNLFRASRLYEDVPATLARLRSTGAVLGCITNKRSAFADELLQLAGIRDRLDFLYGGDSCRDKKPGPDQLLAAAAAMGVPPAESVLIGDSPNDMRAAAAAGFEFVWAAYGYISGMAEQARVPVHRIDRFADLPAVLAEL